jgi:hypothetical protein
MSRGRSAIPSPGDERLCHLAVVDAIGDVGVEAGVATAAVDHAEAGAVGPEVSEQPALPAQVSEVDRLLAFEPVAAWHDDVEGIVQEMLEVADRSAIAGRFTSVEVAASK